MTELDKIQIAGNIFGVLEVYLRIKQKIFCWFFALLGVLTYIYIFYVVKLYADMALQAYYLIMTIYGWYFWINGGKNNSILKVSTLNKKQIIIISIMIVIGTIITGYLLKKYTDDPFPYADSFTTVGAIFGTWLMAKKKIENWIIWIIVNPVSIIIYYMKDLHYTTYLLYFIFTIMAIYGYIKWRKDLLKN
ncbi:MAG: hypothetical protein A2X12_03640 [Bacteroidetes bacterium GWE2_29_8]|nr:MAG: hypothetical protein A2X12_03640 [Bacteroidetes bacterium GWE2_29_8]